MEFEDQFGHAPVSVEEKIPAIEVFNRIQLATNAILHISW
jgi:hypothetical protein